MEDLRLAFLVIGAIAIVGILVHGMWTVRNNSKDNRHANLETADWQDDFDEIEDVDVENQDIIVESVNADTKVEPRLSNDDGSFDDLGLSSVRVVESLEDSDQAIDLSEDADLLAENKTESKPVETAKPKIYSSVVTQPKPEYAAQQVQAMRSKMTTHADGDTHNIPETPPFLLKESDDEKVQGNAQDSGSQVGSSSQQSNPSQQSDPVVSAKSEAPLADEKELEQQAPANISLAEQARNFVKRSKAEPKPMVRKRREPKIADDQMRIDFDQPDASEQQRSQAADGANTTSEDQQSAPAQEVLILNVRASEDNPIQGSALLPMLLTLGFKFGDQDIFHRHVNSNGKGPVLFSLANMLKPGVFDIDHLENFSTLGVSLFMMLPIEGDPHQVFNMMHNAARKIADEFSAQVLDGRRSALTKQSLQQYVEKIREFERQRMIAK